jgi:hypothetical protein
MSDRKHKEHVTETPDVSYIKNVDVTHELSDVYISGIAKFVVALSVLMIASFLLVWGLFMALEANTKEPERSKMAFTDEKDRLPPEPRLQGAPGFSADLEKSARPQREPQGGVSLKITAGAPAIKDPLWEIRVLREQWDDVLKNGPVDQKGKRYGMPIDKAKDEVLKQLSAKKEWAVGSGQWAVGSGQ